MTAETKQKVEQESERLFGDVIYQNTFIAGAEYLASLLSNEDSGLPSDEEIEKKVIDTVEKYKSMSKSYPQLVPSNKDIIIELIQWMRDLRLSPSQPKEQEWISVKDELPPYLDEVEVSFDGITSEGMGRFARETTCMMAGIAGGSGYFTDKFEDLENHLVLHSVTHWRYPKEQPLPPAPESKIDVEKLGLNIVMRLNHEIDSEQVLFKRNNNKDGNALKQFDDAVKEVFAGYKASQNPLPQLREGIVKSLGSNPQNANESYLIANGKNYTRTELSEEIKNETEFGDLLVNNILMLSLDLIARGKKPLEQNPLPVEYRDRATTKFKMYLNSIINKIPDDIHNELWNHLGDCISDYVQTFILAKEKENPLPVDWGAIEKEFREVFISHVNNTATTSTRENIFMFLKQRLTNIKTNSQGGYSEEDMRNLVNYIKANIRETPTGTWYNQTGKYLTNNEIVDEFIHSLKQTQS